MKFALWKVYLTYSAHITHNDPVFKVVTKCMFKNVTGSAIT